MPNFYDSRESFSNATKLPRNIPSALPTDSTGYVYSIFFGRNEDKVVRIPLIGRSPAEVFINKQDIPLAVNPFRNATSFTSITYGEGKIFVWEQSSAQILSINIANQEIESFFSDRMHVNDAEVGYLTDLIYSNGGIYGINHAWDIFRIDLGTREAELLYDTQGNIFAANPLIGFKNLLTINNQDIYLYKPTSNEIFELNLNEAPLEINLDLFTFEDPNLLDISAVAGIRHIVFHDNRIYALTAQNNINNFANEQSLVASAESEENLESAYLLDENFESMTIHNNMLFLLGRSGLRFINLSNNRIRQIYSSANFNNEAAPTHSSVDSVFIPGNFD